MYEEDFAEAATEEPRVLSVEQIEKLVSSHEDGEDTEQVFAQVTDFIEQSNWKPADTLSWLERLASSTWSNDLQDLIIERADTLREEDHLIQAVQREYAHAISAPA